MEKKLLICDMCEEEIGQRGEFSLHYKKPFLWKIIFWKSDSEEERDIDLCDKCHSFIKRLLYGKGDIEAYKVFREAYEIYKRMCVSDREKFATKFIDEIKTNHRYL